MPGGRWVRGGGAMGSASAMPGSRPAAAALVVLRRPAAGTAGLSRPEVAAGASAAVAVCVLAGATPA